MHVGAPVRESLRFVVRDIRSLPPPCDPPSRAFPSSPHRTLLFLLLYLLLRPLLHSFLFVCSSFLTLSSLFPLALGPSFSVPGYRSTSTYTTYSNEPRIVRCISRGTNWILKIKKREARGGEAPHRGGTHRNERTAALHESARSCCFSARPLRSVLARASSSSLNARFVIVSARARTTSHGLRIGGLPRPRFSPTLHENRVKMRSSKASCLK